MNSSFAGNANIKKKQKTVVNSKEYAKITTKPYLEILQLLSDHFHLCSDNAL